MTKVVETAKITAAITNAKQRLAGDGGDAGVIYQLFETLEVLINQAQELGGRCSGCGEGCDAFCGYCRGDG